MRVCMLCINFDTMCQEQTHSMPAVGFGIRFGLVILENPGIDHKIMEVA